MVRINKSTEVPRILEVRGKIKGKKLCDAYSHNTKEYSIPYDKKTNPYKFKFDSKIYGDITVKRQLKDDQGNKCCFCENKDFDDLAYGDVEHYRPRSAYANNDLDTVLRVPGYYWLTYEWKNLLFSCQICNQRHKKNFFPLVSGTTRASNHLDNLELIDNTLLINPTLEDPKDHIGFREEIIYGISDKGLDSIKYYGLDRSLLDKKRKRHFDEVRRNILLSKIVLTSLSSAEKAAVLEELGVSEIDKLQEIINTAIKYISTAANVNAAFALMVQCNFTRLPQH